ncbi:unnamed protein product, partial [Mesorhabditis spiculigera]
MLIATVFLCFLCAVRCDLLSQAPADEVLLKEDETKWRQEAITKLWEERAKIGHTPLIEFPVAGLPRLRLFIKNETATATRSLKHRFVWALAMWAVVDGKVNSNSTAYDSTSGNTGASEAYMFTAIGVPYIAVVATDLEQAKIDNIEKHGGKIMKVDVSLRNFHAKDEAEKNNGFFINQFGNAEQAEEYFESGNYTYESSNVFHEILAQLRDDPQVKRATVDYFVHSAGTGGTISSVGRYVDRYNIPTKVVLADSEFSLFYDYVIHDSFKNESGTKLWRKPGVAGIGYGYDVEPVIFGQTTSLVRSVIDEAVKMPDIATAAALRELNARGMDGGPSSALNILVSLHMALQDPKEELQIVTLMNDPAEFYQKNYFNDEWIEKVFEDRGGMKALECWRQEIASTLDKGTNFLESGLKNCAAPPKMRV